jgi:ligand-binding SRPBCC domain-containing protein
VKLYQLRDEIVLPVELKVAWDFFSDPHNLAIITPPSMGFEMDSSIPHDVRQGQIIQYVIRILPGLNVKWVTEITTVIERKVFIDEQRFGPYRFWHHQHIFTQDANGTRVTDLVHYALTIDPLSRPIHALIVRPRLEDIFSYRRNKLVDWFVRSNKVYS